MLTSTTSRQQWPHANGRRAKGRCGTLCPRSSTVRYLGQGSCADASCRVFQVRRLRRDGMVRREGRLASRSSRTRGPLPALHPGVTEDRVGRARRFRAPRARCSRTLRRAPPNTSVDGAYVLVGRSQRSCAPAHRAHPAEAVLSVPRLDELQDARQASAGLIIKDARRVFRYDALTSLSGKQCDRPRCARRRARRRNIARCRSPVACRLFRSFSIASCRLPVAGLGSRCEEHVASESERSSLDGGCSGEN